jgi:uncharacterized membrane protein YkvA (DUF1232 family)
MFCTNCGARVDADAKFCQRCGNPIKREDDDRGRTQGPSSSGAFGNARRKVEDYVRDPQRTQELLAMALGKANARRSTQGVIDDIWDYLQVAARLVQAAVRGEYTGLSGKSLTLIVAAIIYYVSPIDIIPDFIPVVGLLDDATVLAFALRSIKGELDTFKQWEAERGRGTDR